jgi:hypothetical protein
VEQSVSDLEAVSKENGQEAGIGSSGEKAKVADDKAPQKENIVKDTTTGQAAEKKELEVKSKDETAKRRKPINIPGKKTLPLRLLTRPFANIYDQPDVDSTVVKENVPTFSIFFAYSSPEQNSGWYEVGTDKRGNVLGWMEDQDVIQWKQYLTLTFTNPADRSPTLFFSDKSQLEQLIEDESRSMKVDSIQTTIDEILDDPSQGFPPNFVVSAIEPPDFVDVYKGPYLLPVLSSETTRLDGKLTRILEVASAVKGARKSPVTSESQQSKVNFATDADQDLDILKEWQADIVFVIDATNSMQPYIDATREVVSGMAQTIKKSNLGGKVHFGLVAYRDSVEKIPAIEYTSKIFCNLEEGSDLQVFDRKVAQVKAANVGSQGFDEDVWAGMKMALEDNDMHTHDNASLFIIHIGDAAAHDHPDPMGTTGLVAQRVRELADSHKPYSATVASLHLITPSAKKAKNNHRKAERQFRQIVNTSGDADLYYPVQDGDPHLFEQQSQELIQEIISAVQEAGKGTIQTAAKEPAQTQKAEQGSQKASEAMKGAIRAAQLEYLGSKKTETGDVKAPRDIRAWAVDRDLENPKTKNMQVNLLITKNNLDQLKKSLEAVLEAGTTAQITGEDFFDQLQSVMATATTAPEMVREGLTLQKFGLMPEFLEGLPYKSEILSMTNDMWFDMPPNAQNEFLAKIQSKINLYEAYYNNQDKWIQLNQGDEPGEWVMPMNLNSLP